VRPCCASNHNGLEYADNLAASMSNETVTQGDPRERHQKPPFEEPHQPPPGLETEMRTKPDHGEESYRGFDRLRGKVALITGADSGIGKAVAIAYAREGANVAISHLPEEDTDARETVRWVKDAGRECLDSAGDIRDEAYCRALVEQTVGRFGRLDILVNNAAFQMTHQKLEEFSSEEWDRTFRTNIYAMFYLSKAAVPQMKPGSSIINTASVQAYDPSGPLLAYATTKGAIVTFTKALAQLVVEQGIRVNAVAPGPVWTPLIPSTMPEGKVKKFGEQSLFNRPAQPVEMAPAYVFLATEDSSYMTGSIMDLTGGQLLP
jgi:NAD(P)-dependent dehydrogenase (short-subunit alcohol dehydrogenase family)